VVAAAVGGLPVAVRDGVSGTLVPGHDVDRWAHAIDELLRLGDGPRAWAMHRSAVAHAATFSWDNTVDALLASYRRAISEFTATRRSVRDLASARRGNQVRRWAARRGVRA
jgi:D-inositol-3-phosphate glycosyltransferase